MSAVGILCSHTPDWAPHLSCLIRSSRTLRSRERDLCRILPVSLWMRQKIWLTKAWGPPNHSRLHTQVCPLKRIMKWEILLRILVFQHVPRTPPIIVGCTIGPPLMSLVQIPFVGLHFQIIVVCILTLVVEIPNEHWLDYQTSETSIDKQSKFIGKIPWA